MPDTKNKGGRPRTPGLTARQLQVLRLLADGLLTEEIGPRLDLAARTVEWHISETRQRLGARNIAQLIHFAHIAGILGAPDEVATENRTLDSTLRLAAADDLYLDAGWVYRSASKDPRIDRTQAVYDLETLGRVRLDGGDVKVTGLGRHHLDVVGESTASVVSTNRALITEMYVEQDVGPTAIAGRVGCKSELIRSAVKRWGLVEARDKHRRHRGVSQCTTQSRTPTPERIAA